MQELHRFGYPPVNKAIWSPDSSKVALCGFTEGVSIYSRDHEYNLTLQGHIEHAFSVAWSPDSTRLVCSDHMSTDRDDKENIRQTVRLWDGGTGEQLALLFEHKNTFVGSVRWSASGEKIAGTLSDGSLKVWDARTSEEMLTWRGHGDRYKYALDLLWCDGDQGLLSIGFDNTIKYWSGETGQLKNSIETQPIDPRWINCCPFNNAIIIPDASGSAAIWDVRTGGQRFVLQGTPAPCYGFQWSPDGHLIAAICQRENIAVWDGANGQVVRQKNFPGGRIECIAWHPNRHILAVVNKNALVSIWDLEDDEIVYAFEHDTGSLRQLTWSPDGTRLTSVSEPRYAQIWDMTKTPQPLLSYPEGVDAQEGLNVIAWSPDQKYLAQGFEGGQVWIWDAETDENRPVQEIPRGFIETLAWSPDSRQLASGHSSTTNTIQITDISSYSIVSQFQTNGNIYAMKWHLDGHKLNWIASDATGKCILFTRDLDTAQTQDMASPDYMGAWNNDGTQFVSISYIFDNPIKYQITEVINKETTFPLPNEIALHDALLPVHCIALGPTNTRLALGTGIGHVYVVDISTERVIVTLEQHTMSVGIVAWHPDGNLLASGSEDQTVVVWDVSTGEVVATMHHSSTITGIEWTKDGSLLATAGLDGVVSIWGEPTNRTS